MTALCQKHEILGVFPQCQNFLTDCKSKRSGSFVGSDPLGSHTCLDGQTEANTHSFLFLSLLLTLTLKSHTVGVDGSGGVRPGTALHMGLLFHLVFTRQVFSV